MGEGTPDMALLRVLKPLGRVGEGQGLTPAGETPQREGDSKGENSGKPRFNGHFPPRPDCPLPARTPMFSSLPRSQRLPHKHCRRPGFGRKAQYSGSEPRGGRATDQWGGSG